MGLQLFFPDKKSLLLIWKSRSQGLGEEQRGTESKLFEALREIATFSDNLVCHVICWWPLCLIKSRVNVAIYQEVGVCFMLPSADKLYGDAGFLFQQNFSPALTANITINWVAYHGISLVDWPANSPDQNPMGNQWGIIKRKMKDNSSNNTNELKVAVTITWASTTPQQCHRLTAPCHTLKWT